MWWLWIGMALADDCPAGQVKDAAGDCVPAPNAPKPKKTPPVRPPDNPKPAGSTTEDAERAAAEAAAKEQAAKERAAAERAARERAAKAERERLARESAAPLQADAASEWSTLRPRIRAGTPEGRTEAELFISKWAGRKVTVQGVDYPVAIPQLDEAWQVAMAPVRTEPVVDSATVRPRASARVPLIVTGSVLGAAGLGLFAFTASEVGALEPAVRSGEVSQAEGEARVPGLQARLAASYGMIGVGVGLGGYGLLVAHPTEGGAAVGWSGRW